MFVAGGSEIVIQGLYALGFQGFRVEARKLEHHYPHALKVKYKGILAPILLKPCSNFLASTVGYRGVRIVGITGLMFYD